MGQVRFYGKRLPNMQDRRFNGALVVLEGGDGAGRSTQSVLLRDALERIGYPTTLVGLKRSELVGEELDEAMEGNQLCPLTLSLFYATDFVDQLERTIIPALRAGFVVLADRYIYTLMARDIVRGADPEWIKSVYDIALVPDIILYLKAPARTLAERSLRKDGGLDYWESGMDIQRSGDVYQCFLRYQNEVQAQFQWMQKEYGFHTLNGARDPFRVHDDILKLVQSVLRPLGKANARRRKAG